MDHAHRQVEATHKLCDVLAHSLTHSLTHHFAYKVDICPVLAEEFRDLKIAPATSLDECREMVVVRIFERDFDH